MKEGYRVLSAACLGAALGGVLDWVLNTYVFPHGGVPGAFQPLLDIVVCAVACALFGWLAAIGAGRKKESLAPGG